MRLHRICRWWHYQRRWFWGRLHLQSGQMPRIVWRERYSYGRVVSKYPIFHGNTRVSWCLLCIFPETNPAELPTAISHGSHRSHRFHRFHRLQRHSRTWVDFRTEMGRSLRRTSSWSMTAPDWFRPQERVRSWFGVWKRGDLYTYTDTQTLRPPEKKQAFQRKNEKIIN